MAKGGRHDSEPSEYYEQQSEYEEEAAPESKRGGSAAGTIIRWVTVLFLFIAFVLMAFASATPVTEKLHLFSLKIKADAVVSKTSFEVWLGVWGYCTSGVETSTGIGSLSFDSKVTEGGCKERRLGWTFEDVTGIPDSLEDGISAALTSAFSLHIISAATILVALIAAIIGAAKRVRPASDGRYSNDGDPYYDPTFERASSSRRTFFVTLLALIFTGTIFAIDVAAIVVVSSKVSDATRGVATFTGGTAFGFVVAALFLVLCALFLAIFDASSTSRHSPAPLGPRTADRPSRSLTPPRSPSRYATDYSQESSRDADSQQYSQYGRRADSRQYSHYGRRTRGPNFSEDGDFEEVRISSPLSEKPPPRHRF